MKYHLINAVNSTKLYSFEFCAHLMSLQALCFVHLKWFVHRKDCDVVSVGLSEEMSRGGMKLQTSAAIPFLQQNVQETYHVYAPTDPKSAWICLNLYSRMDPGDIRACVCFLWSKIERN